MIELWQCDIGWGVYHVNVLSPECGFFRVMSDSSFSAYQFALRVGYQPLDAVLLPE